MVSQAIAKCIRENEFHQTCWSVIANFAEEFKEFRDKSELERYLRELGLPKELIDMVIKVVDVRKGNGRIAVFINPRMVVVGDGGQYFGSGDYSHKTVILGDVELETVEIIEYDNGFVRGCYEICRVVRRPTAPAVVYHVAWDYTDEQKRFFDNELYVWP